MEDLASKNGTFVNATKVTRIQLALYDTISIGSTEIRILADKNASGINDLLNNLKALNASERPKLEVEDNPTLASIRHNPITAIHKSPTDVNEKKVKLRNNKLFADAHLEGQADGTATPAKIAAIHRAKMIDNIVVASLVILSSSLAAFLDAPVTSIFVIGIVVAGAMLLFNTRYPHKTLGHRLMAIDYDD